MKRKAFFYAARFFKSAGSGSLSSVVQMDASEILDTFADMGSLVFDETSPTSAYSTTDDGKIAILIDRAEGTVEGIFFKSRRINVPNIEKNGKFRVLDLTSKEGVSEAAHFVIFPQDDGKSVMAIESNIYAPRYVHLPEYLMSASERCLGSAEDFAFVRIVPIMRGNTFDQFLSDGNISDVEIEVRRDAVETVKSADKGLGDYLEASRDIAPEAWILKFGFKRKPYSRNGGMGDNFKQRLVNVLNILVPRGFVHSAKAKIESGENGGRLTPVDLLNDKYVANITILPLRAFLGDGLPERGENLTDEQLDELRMRRSTAIYDDIKSWYYNSDIDVTRRGEDEVGALIEPVEGESDDQDFTQ